MPTAEEWLEFFYPSILNGESLAYASPQDRAMALSVAENFRPTCLNAEQQNQAQAHYAAYVLQFRQAMLAAGYSAAETATAVVAGPIIEKQEGSTRVRYSEKAAASGGSTSIQLTTTGPGTPYAAWLALWNMCMGITDAGGEVVRRGGIITRFGFPD